MSVFSSILRDNRFRPDDVPAFEKKLFYEGERRRPYLERFFALLILATIIATAGVLGDSTATVIGAMIVAPLMTPIMAAAAALVMGNMRRAADRLALVAAGILVVVALAWLFARFFTGVVDFETNSQITGRISPRIIDLIAALASGAAGAFCLSREDIADSLPGVAIAISLVPPLCVVGLALANGQTDAALGALLLFTTNFLAILLAGGAVLAVLGLNGAARITVVGSARRRAFAAVLIATLLVAVPLTLSGRAATRLELSEIRSRSAAQTWSADSGYRVRQVRAYRDGVYIGVIGQGDLPSFDDLVSGVEAAVGYPLDVSLEVLPSQLLVNR